MTHYYLTLLVLCLLVLLSTAQMNDNFVCPDESDTGRVFFQQPTNLMRQRGEDAIFNCSLTQEFRDEMYVISWRYVPYNNSGASITIANGVTDDFSIDPDGNLHIFNIQSSHAAEYTCSARNFIICDEVISASANLTVIGSPVISSFNQVNEDTNSTITSRITGFPIPSVRVLRVGDSQPINDPRFSTEFNKETLMFTLIVSNVIQADAGEYFIEATNVEGVAIYNFTIVPQGPDPPVLTADATRVSNINDRVAIDCMLQPEGFAQGTQAVWKDAQGNEVPSSDANIISETLAMGSTRLVIITFTTDLQDTTYTCCVENVRGRDTAETQLFGPPPPPANTPVVTESNEGFNVRWTRPTTNVPINRYIVRVLQSDTDVEVDMKSVDVLEDHTEGSCVITGLDIGSYDVVVLSVSDGVRGTDSERANFEVTAEPAAFPVVIVAAAAGGAIVLVVVVVIVVAISVYCYCSYKARKNQINSQHRTWSEEEKVNQPAAVQNTYTALALHDNAILPPSPLSPMASSIGIDPKWEFPRENVSLSDVISEGQFTVLYKGVAKGLRPDKPDKTCEIAVKALKEDATEDDFKALAYEMDLLANMDEHPNIVSLVRVCSVGRPVFMVLEYMCHGDLLGFLRACRGHHGMYAVSPGTRYQPPALQLHSRDILNMAIKIAHGMRYLADRKIVHRALCARNVLVGSGLDIKIYNVGSFDMSIDNKDGLTKWMAPETLFDGTNTTYSDVWSFGITMWELVTVGGTPYGEILSEDLYPQLQSGMRMPCPQHCKQEVYNIMSACWQKNPIDRPHFAIILEHLDDLVTSKVNCLDLKSYDVNVYSQFGDDVQLSTAL